jgi:poly-gamma-glutamate capsule biosynthesis protein CapA/YwtB (metallophosphatase superfamily)
MESGTGSRTASFVAVGDIGPLRDDAEVLFERTRNYIRSADVSFGQLEKCLSKSGTQQLYLNKSLGRTDPRVAGVIADAGFKVLSFASNHTMAFSSEGLTDTLENLSAAGVKVIGAGSDIAAARQPAVFEVNGTRIGILAYCSVVPRGFEAGEHRPGLAPVRVRTFYEQRDWQPGTPPRIVTIAYPEDVEAMAADIRALRPHVDALVVSHHWGVHVVPALIADYQFDVGRASIDAGADLVVGHHPHILKGVEVYRGKVILYSIGAYAQEHPRRDVVGTELAELIKQYRLTIDPDWVRFSFPIDSQKTVLVRCEFSSSGFQRVALRPAWINPQAQAELLAPDDPRFDEVVDYLRYLTHYYELNARFDVDGDEVVVSST